MKQVVIHVGTSKTGTSSLQAALAANRSWLSQHGVHYPEQRGSTHHHRFAWSVRDDAREARNFMEAVLASPSPRAIVSSEAMYLGVHGGSAYDAGERYWDQRLRYLDELERATSGARRTIVVVFRRPDEFAESLYYTAVLRDDVRVSFDDFRRLIRPLLQYERQEQAFREQFEDVRVVSFSDVRDDLLGRMATVFGLPDFPVRPEIHNVSADARATIWMLERNRRKRHSRLHRSFVQSQLAKKLFDAPSSHWESGEARDEFCRSLDWVEAPATGSKQFVNALTKQERRAIDAAFLLYRVGRLVGLKSS